MFPYFLVFTIFILLGVLYAYTSQGMIRVCCVYLFFGIFIFFYSFSCNIGLDWRNYKVYYEKLSSLSLLQAFDAKKTGSQFEPLFLLLAYILNRLFFSYQGLVFVLSLGALLLYYDVFKKLFGNLALIVLAFFTILYGNRLFISTLRQNIATVFVFYTCWAYISNKKWLLYFVIAFLFHYSSIIILGAIVLEKLKISKMLYVIMTLAFTFLAFFRFDLGIVFLDLFSVVSSTGTLISKIKYYLGRSEMSLFNFFDIFYCLLYLYLIFHARKISIFHALGLIFLFFNLLFPTMTLFIFRFRYYLSIGFIYPLIKEVKYKENIELTKLFAAACFCLLFNAKIYVWTDDTTKYNRYEKLFDCKSQ